MALQKTRAECARCGGARNHEILHREWRNEHDEHRDADVTYLMVRCLGCESISFLIMEEWLDKHARKRMDRERSYPSGISRRVAVQRTDLVPEPIRDLYLECLRVLGVEAPVLGGIAVRAVVEAVCKDRQAAGGSLEAKIDGLVDRGALSRDQASFLHRTRLMGNQAAHEMRKLSDDELAMAMDVAEYLLQTVYILPEAMHRLDHLPAAEDEADSVDDGWPGEDELGDEDPFGDE